MEISGVGKLTVLRKTLDMLASQAKLVIDQGNTASQAIAASARLDIRV